MFTESATVQRINRQCVIWLHKPSGVKYRKDFSNGAAVVMQSLSHPPKVVSEDELSNSEIWSQA